MIFQDRQGTNLNRKKIKIISQTKDEIIADIERADTVTQEGTIINAQVFNQFQESINAANTAANNAVTNSNSAIATANQASADSTTALTTANSANTNSTSAVNTANTASANAMTALEKAQQVENKIPTFSLNGTILNITSN